MCLCVLNKWRLYDESIEFLIMTYRSFCEIHLIVVFYLFGSYYGKARKSNEKVSFNESITLCTKQDESVVVIVLNPGFF